MIEVGQDAEGRWAFMIFAQPSKRLVYSAWDFETPEEAVAELARVIEIFSAAARELERRDDTIALP